MTTYTSNLVENNGAFIETECTITHDGKDYTSSGAWLCKRVDTGKYEGMLYLKEKPTLQLTSWDGSIVIPCKLVRIWINNWGDKRICVHFSHVIDNTVHYFTGICYAGTLGFELTRVREIREKTYKRG